MKPFISNTFVRELGRVTSGKERKLRGRKVGPNDLEERQATTSV